MSNSAYWSCLVSANVWGASNHDMSIPMGITWLLLAVAILTKEVFTK